MMQESTNVRSLPRLLASCIDFYAKDDPDRSYAAVPRSHNLADGLQDISYKEFANAINRTCWWLDSHLGKSTADAYDTFAYFGPRDLRYCTFFVAAIKTGRKILLASPSISLKGLLNIFEAVQCQAFLCATLPPVDSHFACLPARVERIVVPSLEQLFDNEHVQEYVYDKAWQDAKNDPVAVFHSSGTTGLPKPVVYTNAVLAYFDCIRTLQIPTLHLSQLDYSDRRIYSPFPLSHLGGISMALLYPVYFGMTIVLGPAEKPPSADTSDQIIRSGAITGAAYPPFLIEEIASKPSLLDNLLKLEVVHSGSAPLGKSTGELLCKQIRLRNIYGSTEMTLLPQFGGDAEDWEYLAFHPCSGIEFVYRSSTLYEMLVIRKEEFNDYQPIFKVYPDIHHFYTKDLWSEHPVKPGLWKYCGRTDDTIILSNGQNLDVTSMEWAIQESPHVRGAIIGGQGRSSPFLLIELLNTSRATATQSHETTIDDIWSSVENANRLCNKKAELSQRLTIITSPQKSFARVAKGSIDRRKTIELYQEKINELYSFTEDKKIPNKGA